MDSMWEHPHTEFSGPASRSESRSNASSGTPSRSGHLNPPSRSDSRFASLDPAPPGDYRSVSLDRPADQAVPSSDETTVLGDLDNMVDNVVDSVMDIAFEAHSSVLDFLSDITGQITSRKAHKFNIIPEDVQVGHI